MMSRWRKGHHPCECFSQNISKNSQILGALFCSQGTNASTYPVSFSLTHQFHTLVHTYQLPYAVQHQVDALLAHCVVAPGIVVSCILLPCDQLLWMEELTVGSCPNFIYQETEAIRSYHIVYRGDTSLIKYHIILFWVSISSTCKTPLR